ncbi:RHS repeat-associated core domain-containing protein [uncultured Robinsoniella sp.]|uniref:RHS repeat-associated core domain-containing protein n=1 Tax=uncultured Robinsoniella sp. TaxID=904190 RepID=UPI00374E4019
MWRKQKKKRMFRSFICMVLAILIFITDVPDLGLVLKVMANPRPNQLAVAEERVDAEAEMELETNRVDKEENTNRKNDTTSEYETEGITEIETEETESIETYSSENIDAELLETEMTDRQEQPKEPETEVESTESVGENSSVKKDPEYVKTVIPEDIVYDEIINGDTVLSSGGVISDKKLLYQGDVIFDSNVQFSNCTIRITGDVVMQSGSLNAQNSIVWVDGTFRIQSESEEGKYGDTAAYLTGGNNACVVVKGDFYTQSMNINNQINKGLILELYGNFHHLGDSSYNRLTNASGTLVFVGEKAQHVSMGSQNGKLKNIEIANSEGTINADTPLWGVDLTHDTVITGKEVDLEGRGNGYKLIIEGDFLGTQLKLNNGSTLHIKGDYRIQEIEGLNNGYLYGSDSAQILVDGDLRIQEKKEDGSFGETTAFLCSAYELRIVVKGDFYTQSKGYENGISSDLTLELYGDFIQLDESFLNYNSSLYGKVIFAGNGDQQIIMEGKYAILKGIVQDESCTGIIFQCTGGTVSLASDIIAKGYSLLHNMEMNGYTADLMGEFNITGSLKLMGGALQSTGNITMKGGFIYPQKGIVHINGNLILEGNGGLAMSEDSDLVVIKGSLLNNSGSDQVISRGILDVKGDFIQSTTRRFTTSQNAFMQISGSYHHNVEFPELAYVWFYNLGVDAGLDYTFTRQPIWTNLFQAMETGHITERIASRYFGKSGANPATGNYSQGFSDITVQSAMGPFEITHSYNSMSEEDGVLGKGFVFSQNIKMKSETILDTDQKTVFMPDGSRYTFLKNSSGNYEAQDSRSELTEENGSFLLKTQDQALFSFDEKGNIQYMEDKTGNRMTYSVDENGNTVRIQDDSGTDVSFHYKEKLLKSIINEETGETARFEYTEGKLSKYIDANGKSTGYLYNSEGLLAKIINHDGSTFEEITYIKGGKHDKKVKTVKNMAGNVDTYKFDDIFRKTTITDSNGRRVTKEFDFHYNLTASTNALGETVRTRYALTNGMNKYGEIESETDAYGNVTTYTRDTKGRVTRVAHPDGTAELTEYDEQNNITKSIDKNGTATYYLYDNSGKYLLKKATPLDGKSVYLEGADEEGFAVTSYTYDMDHVIKGAVLTETGPLGDEKNYLAYIRNQKGQILAMTTYMDGDAFTTAYGYNDKWLPIKETAPDGVVIKYVYNKYNEIIRKATISEDGRQRTYERYSYDEMGNKEAEAGPLSYDSSLDDLKNDVYTGPGTRFTYNEAGQVTTKTDALGNTTSFEYDLYGNTLKEYYPDGSYTAYTYDALDRKTSTVFYDSTTSKRIRMEELSYSQSGKNLLTTTTVYLDTERTAVTTQITDFAGRVTRATDAAGNSTSRTYTGDGKVATETDPYGKRTTYTYDALGNLISQTTPFEGNFFAKGEYTYDKAGNKLTEIIYNNPAGSTASSSRKTSYEYDAWNNLIATIQYEGDNPVSYVQGYYDFRGRLLREYKGLSVPLTISGLDEVHQNGDDEYTVTKYEYNYQDKVVQIIDGAGQMESSTYDSAGNLLRTQEQGGGTYQAVYDILGQKTEESKSFPGKTTIAKTFSYDNMGRLVSTTENEETVTFVYNGLGQTIAENDSFTDKEYMYDHTGAVLSMKISNSSGNLRHTKNTYDLLGRLTSVSENGKLKASYTYDKVSRLLTTKYENGITETNVYNDAGLPKSVVNKDISGKIISEYKYIYAVDGNQLSKTDAGGTTSYQYDGLNRLTEETHTNTGEVETTSYKYDENGNRTRMEKRTGNGLKWEEYTYDQLDRILTKSTPDGITAYTYDRNGNQLTKSEDEKEEIQTYDALNRLISWTDGSKMAEYTYYPDNNRAAKMVDGVTTRHIWSGGEIQVDITEGKTVNYIHGHRLIESDYGTYLYNAHGDVVQLVKDDQVVERYDYDAYGNPKEEKSGEKKAAERQEDRQSNSSNSDRNPYRYAGEYRDEETGYIYLRARYYDVKLGRFLNADPAKQGTNWYAYSGGNPVLYHDPSGLFFSEAWQDIKNTGKKLVSGAKSFFNSIGSAASSAGKKVKEFASTPGGKIAVGVSVIAIAGIATLATGGAAAGLAGGIAQGALVGSSAAGAIGAGSGAYSAVVANREKTGSWDGSFSAALDGAASGFQSGALSGGFIGMPIGAASYGTSYLTGQMMNPNSPLYRNNKIPESEKIIELYRAVSPEEFDDIFSSNSFRGKMDGTTLQAKEFGNSFSETLDFANRSINSDKAAIIKVSIPESIYNKLTHMNLDPGIFKSGTPVVEPNMLNEFNNNIISIEHIY